MDLLDSGGDKDFPIRDFDKILYSFARYCNTTDPPEADKVPLAAHPSLPPNVDGNYYNIMMIEAPISSVEVIEAILKPEQPFQIYRARHVPRRRITQHRRPESLSEYQKMYDEYSQWQGRLEKEDREISYICLPHHSLNKLRLHGICWPVRLDYIGISGRQCDRPPKSLFKPWALVLRYRHGTGDRLGCGLAPTTGAERLQRLLEKLGIPDCQFERSRLRPGTVPLPECVLYWIEGIPGSTLALPYYSKDSDAPSHINSKGDSEDEEDSDATIDHLGN
jgi:hypothetical protein